jgi:hypothetical protein
MQRNPIADVQSHSASLQQDASILARADAAAAKILLRFVLFGDA